MDLATWLREASSTRQAEPALPIVEAGDETDAAALTPDVITSDDDGQGDVAAGD
jgi:hypothetical protein